MPQNTRKTAQEVPVRLLNLSKAASTKAKEKVIGTAKEKYQLQLRVDEQFHEYMEELVARSGVETTSELVRLALRELDRARTQYDGIKLSNNVVIGPEAEPEKCVDRVVPFRKQTATRRINVVLRGVALERLQRLIEWCGGLPLVDLVAIALGVLDTVLTTEEELSASSIAHQSAQLMTEAEHVDSNAMLNHN